jgi:dienelactone hydrolase
MHEIITAEDFAKKSKLSEVRANNQYVFWLEANPQKSGRQYLCCYIIKTKQRICLTSPDDYNIRSGINEYGGGSYWLNDNGLYFFNKDNNSVYYINFNNDVDIYNATPVLIKASLSLNDNITFNYADGIVLTDAGFIAVREIISTESLSIKQQLIVYDLMLDKIFVLDEQQDFYAFPRINQQTNQLLWISWEHPNMPWDKSVLYLADIGKTQDKYYLTNKKILIDIDNNSLYQPEWYDNNSIFIVSEHENDFWNLYSFNLQNKQFIPIITGNFEQALPLWQLGTNTYGYTVSNNAITIYCYKMSHGQSTMAIGQALIDPNSQTFDFKILNIQDIQNISVTYIQDRLNLSNGNLYFLANTSITDPAVYEYSIEQNNLQVISYNDISVVAKSTVSKAEEIAFTNKYGLTSYGFFYQPENISTFDTKKLPPLIIICHGGPTGTTNSGYNTKIQYWTTRGFAVLDVNYSGSTTYGKQYRERINLQWGVIDVADCAAGAEYLIDNNKVDKNNIIIRGSSAGGLIVLLALYQYDIFSAGCCYYPVSDLILLSEQIHNFERHYNDYLIGDLKKDYEQYKQRSPINFAKQLTKPLLLFHADQDKVIPVEHTRTLFNELKDNNKLSQYIEFAQEGHGFKKINTIKTALEHEYLFYLNVMGI